MVDASKCKASWDCCQQDFRDVHVVFLCVSFAVSMTTQVDAIQYSSVKITGDIYVSMSGGHNFNKMNNYMPKNYKDTHFCQVSMPAQMLSHI